MKPVQDKSVMFEAFRTLRPTFKKVLLFSVFTNLMVLAPSWYMLEVYDRVISSRNHTTLLMLTLLVIGIYLVMEVLEWVRAIMMQQAALALDANVRDHLFNTAFSTRLRKQIPVGVQPFNDLKMVRDVLPSAGIFALIDAPFALMFLIIIFLMHPSLGLLAMLGAVVLVILSVVNERRIHPPLKEANRHAMAAQSYADSVIKNAQVIKSMGMLADIHQRWIKRQHDFLVNQASASDGAAVNSALSKLVQTMQGSLILGFGCWLTLRGELNAGGAGMIVASILAARVLSPLVQVIAYWRTLIGTKDAYNRLDKMLSDNLAAEASMALPAPKGDVSVEALVAGPPNSNQQILRNVSFRIAAGETLAIVGPSASGKSTLARLLIGVWPAMSGKVRLDGADIYAWSKEELGAHVGYLPQDVELFDGSIAENIARFGVIDESQVDLALQAVGMTDFVDTLPQGTLTQIGLDGSFLSGGQRQLIALARAVYNQPKYIVLDEPNSSLDDAGDAALLHTLQRLKSAGSTIIVITHRQQILAAADKMLVLLDGQVRLFGPRDEVLKELKSTNMPTQTTSQQSQKSS